MKNRSVIYCLAAALVLMFLGCSSQSVDPAAAKEKLTQMAAGHRIDDVSETNFVYCAFMGDMEAVQLYLDSGMNVNVKNSYGRTPLIAAAAAEPESPWYDKNADIIKLLLKNGADVNAKDNDGMTALATAEKAGRPAIAQLLKDSGAAQ